MTVIDGKELIVGRMASRVAKRALLGEEIDIVNCEKTVVTGRKQEVLNRYKKIKQRGTPKKGPFIHTSPEKFVKRKIRGMLPYKRERGKLALQRIRCHKGVPKHLEKQEMEKMESAHISKLKILKYMYIEDIAKHIGGK